MTAVSKDHNVEIRSALEDAGWWAKARYLDKEDAPEGVTVSGLDSGVLVDAFKQADLDMKEDSTKEAGLTYILIGPIEDKEQNDS